MEGSQKFRPILPCVEGRGSKTNQEIMHGEEERGVHKQLNSTTMEGVELCGLRKKLRYTLDGKAEESGRLQKSRDKWKTVEPVMALICGPETSQPANMAGLKLRFPAKLCSHCAMFGTSKRSRTSTCSCLEDETKSRYVVFLDSDLSASQPKSKQ